MLYFLHGDFKKAADKASDLAKAMLKKQPDASRFRLDEDNFSESELQSLLGGQGLFSQKYIVDLRRLLEKDDIKEKVISLVNEIKKSPNIFIWVEGDDSLDKKDLDLIEKHAEKVQFFETNSGKEKTVDHTEIYRITDALGEKDKKKLWQTYTNLLDKFEVEHIYGTLFWQIKNMILVSKSSSPKDADLKPFVFNKTKNFLNNYSKEDLEKLSTSFIKISHDSRRGMFDLKIGLERWLLEI